MALTDRPLHVYVDYVASAGAFSILDVPLHLRYQSLS